jgi:hypothetical protein
MEGMVHLDRLMEVMQDNMAVVVVVEVIMQVLEEMVVLY